MSNDTTTTDRQVITLPTSKVEPHPDNARKTLRDIDELTASVRSIGIVQPITVKTVNGSGTYQVVAGHRRLAAAKAAGIDVPAIVLDDQADAQAVALVMLAENEARDDLSTAERVRAVQVALDLGANLDDIATVTGVATDELTTVAKLNDTPVAVGLAERHDLTLDQALVMAEFADDKDILKALTKIAVQSPERWDHEVAWIRRRRDERLAIEQAIATYTEQGATFGTSGDLTKRSLPLRRLVNPKGKAVTEAQHAKCPHRLIVVEPEYTGGPDKVTEWCVDPKAGGHADAWAHVRTGNRQVDDGTAADTDDDETERERRSAERKQTLANNRALDVANGVRREYVTNLLGRRKVTGEVQFVMHTILNDYEVLSLLKGDTWVALTGAKAKPHSWHWRGDVAAGLLGKAPTDADRSHVAFGMVVASIESTIDKTAWRGAGDRLSDYLTFLKGTGYTLSDIEAEIVKTVKTARGKK